MNIAPHKWPGKEGLAKLRVKMRVLDIRLPNYFNRTSLGGVTTLGYFELPTTRQKQLYDIFRRAVNREYNRRVK